MLNEVAWGMGQAFILSMKEEEFELGQELVVDASMDDMDLIRMERLHMRVV